MPAPAPGGGLVRHPCARGCKVAHEFGFECEAVVEYDTCGTAPGYVGLKPLPQDPELDPEDGEDRLACVTVGAQVASRMRAGQGTWSSSHYLKILSWIPKMAKIVLRASRSEEVASRMRASATSRVLSVMSMPWPLNVLTPRPSTFNLRMVGWRWTSRATTQRPCGTAVRHNSGRFLITEMHSQMVRRWRQSRTT